MHARIVHSVFPGVAISNPPTAVRRITLADGLDVPTVMPLLKPVMTGVRPAGWRRDLVFTDAVYPGAQARFWGEALPSARQAVETLASDDFDFLDAAELERITAALAALHPAYLTLMDGTRHHSGLVSVVDGMLRGYRVLMRDMPTSCSDDQYAVAVATLSAGYLSWQLGCYDRAEECATLARDSMMRQATCDAPHWLFVGEQAGDLQFLLQQYDASVATYGMTIACAAEMGLTGDTADRAAWNSVVGMLERLRDKCYNESLLMEPQAASDMFPVTYTPSLLPPRRLQYVPHRLPRSTDPVQP